MTLKTEESMLVFDAINFMMKQFPLQNNASPLLESTFATEAGRQAMDPKSRQLY